MIILDLDNTLIDHSGAERRAAALFGDQYSDVIPKYHSDTFAQRWHDAAELHIAAFLSGAIGFQEQRRRRIRKIFESQEISPSDADALFLGYLKHYEESWQLFPDVFNFLKTNKQHGLAILSDGEQEQQETKLKKTGIYHYFGFVLTAESTGLSKPEPMMFHRACERGGVSPEDAYYIGDNLKKDAIGSCKAGLRGVWLNRTGKPIPVGIESISSLSEFVPNK